MSLYLITGEHDEAPASDVTATDLPTLPVREETTTPSARGYTERAQPGCQEAQRDHRGCSKPPDTFCASLVDCDRNHGNDTVSWQCVLENKFANLMRGLSVMLTPEASGCIGVKAIVTTHVHQMAEGLKFHPAVPHDAMSPFMPGRERITGTAFSTLVDIARSGSPIDHHLKEFLQKMARTRCSHRTAQGKEGIAGKGGQESKLRRP